MKPVRVLLADDHEVVRKGLRAILESHGEFEVVGEAANGREAVDQTAKLKPDMVILDIGMEGMNGLEATRHIVKYAPQTQVLILTMHESDGMAGQALQAGARGYLLKTDAGRDLLLALNSLRQKKTFFTNKVAEMLVKDYRRTKKSPGGHFRFRRLTSREKEILQLLAEGKTSKEIAQMLSISLKTVDTHRGHIMSKLDLHSVAQLVRYAIRERIVQP